MICDIQTAISSPIVLEAKESVEVIEGIHQRIIKEHKRPLWHKLLIVQKWPSTLQPYIFHI